MKKNEKFSLEAFEQLTAQEEVKILGGGDWKGSTTVDKEKVGSVATGNVGYSDGGLGVNSTLSSSGNWSVGASGSLGNVTGSANYGSSGWSGSASYNTNGLNGSLGLDKGGMSASGSYSGNGWSIGGGGSSDGRIFIKAYATF